MKFLSFILSIYTAFCSCFAGIFPGLAIKITVEPTVFECGSCYAVMWETNYKGSGALVIEEDGERVTYWDSRSGDIRTDDTIHSVKIPHEALAGKEYSVKSERVLFKYAYSAIKMDSVQSGKYSFNGVPKKDGLNIFSISDIHGMEKEMLDSVAKFTEKPDLIVLLGDIPSMMEKKAQFTTVLEDAHSVSGGETPVVYVRGNHETRGEFAAQVADYFPTSTGELYFDFSFGPLSAVVIDAGEDKNDDNIEYSGLVDFNAYREQEYQWIKSLDGNTFDGTYNIVFSHMPILQNHFGKDWSAPLEEAGAQLIVGGHHHCVDFVEDSLPYFIDCGKNDSTRTYAASMLTLSGGEIHMKTIDNNGQVLFDKTI